MLKLFTIRHGSWLYGTNTETSDIDLKTIYVPDYGDMLLGRKMESFKYRESGEHDRTKPDEVEDEYIPLQSFATHFLGGQSYALEMAFAFLDNVCVEYVNPAFDAWTKRFVQELVDGFTNRNVDSIVGYAYSQSLKYGLKGERLQAIRDLKVKVEAIRENSPKPNLTLADVAYSWFDRDNKKAIFITDIEATRSNEAMEALSIGNKLYAFNTTLKHFSKALDILENKYGARTEQALSGHDWKAISHSIRITGQGCELLNTGRLEFPNAMAEYLLRVKKGFVPEEEAYARLEELFRNLKTAKEETELRSLTPELHEEFNEWLKDWLMTFYSTKESGNDR